MTKATKFLLGLSIGDYLWLLYSYIATVTADPILNFGGSIDVTGRIISGSMLFVVGTAALIASRVM